MILQQLLMYYSNSNSYLKILRTESGKPYVQEPIHFSYSHSHGVYLYCVSTKIQMGVDIEKINPSRPYMQLAERYFNSTEFDFLKKMEKSSRLPAFFKLWTAKEAFCKYHGGNLWSYLRHPMLPMKEGSSAMHSESQNKTFYMYSSLRFQGYAYTVSTQLPVKKIFINTVG